MLTGRRATRVVVRVRHRLSRADDRGWTLIELLVAMVITAVALALVIPVLTTVTTVTSSTNSGANGTAQARQVLQQLSSDIGSATAGNVCFPAAVLVTPPTTTCSGSQTTGYPLVVLSRVYANCTWFQWNVNSSGQLVQQSAPRGGTAWSSAVALAGPLVNTVSPSLFTYDTTNSLMNIQLILRGATGTAAGASAPANRPGTQTTDFQTSVGLVTSAQSAAAGSC